MHPLTSTKTHSPSDGLLTQCIRISLESRFTKIGEIHSKECTILSSQAAGSGEVDKAAQVLNRTLVSGTLFFVLMAGIMFFIQELIYWIGIEPAVADVAVLYSRITLAAFLIWMYYDSFR